jgi:ADP-ribosylglycohydrolase
MEGQVLLLEQKQPHQEYAFRGAFRMDTLHRYLGCIYGIAIGDALGFPVEFEHSPTVTTLAGRALYSDDTQMSLATVDGLIEAKPGDDLITLVYREYLKWLDTQKKTSERRAPGGTCISALASGRMGTVDNRLNDSKGCGGVMRTAPVGLACVPRAAFQHGVEFAAITHSHPSGYLSAGFLSELISHLVDGQRLEESLDASTRTLTNYDDNTETLLKVEQARRLAMDNNEYGIAAIGGGWVGEEALAIAIYCSLRFQGDWKAGVLAAVNHAGDSDSTGSIAGAILGTLLGIDAIPSSWVEKVENSELLRSKATTLYECYGTSRITQVKKQLSVFPLTAKCPICGGPLTIPKAGRYPCPKCKTTFLFDREGRVTLE